MWPCGRAGAAGAVGNGAGPGWNAGACTARCDHARRTPPRHGRWRPGAAIGASALSGAALNAADTAVRGGDVTTGAGIGAATGATGPLVGRVMGAGLRAAGNLLSGFRPHLASGRVPMSGLQTSLGQRPRATSFCDGALTEV